MDMVYFPHWCGGIAIYRRISIYPRLWTLVNAGRPLIAGLDDRRELSTVYASQHPKGLEYKVPRQFGVPGALQNFGN